MITDGTEGAGDSATVGNRQRVARAEIPDVKAAAVVPDRVTTGDEDRVAIGTELIANGTGDIQYSAAIGNRQGVTRAIRADVEVAAVGPAGTGTGDSDAVIDRVGVVTDVTSGVTVAVHDNATAIGDGQRVPGTDVADGEPAGVGPDRAATGDEDGVVISASVDANCPVAINHAAAGGDEQRVTGTEVTDVEVAAVAPD